ncbi:MAG: HAMP domain-containing protein [Burkholderiales bacterium]|nr:MAG: HAMP domain-containing protein [Burkholderiales bacterium]
MPASRRAAMASSASASTSNRPQKDRQRPRSPVLPVWCGLHAFVAAPQRRRQEKSVNHLLKNASIGIKVAMAPAIAILCLMLVTGIGWFSARSLTTDLREVAGAGVERVVSAQAFATQLTQLHQKLYQSMTWEAIGQRAERIKDLDNGLLAELTAFGKTLDGAGGDDSLSAEQQVALRNVHKTYLSYAKTAADALDMKSAGVANAAGYVVTVDSQYAKVREQIDAFVKVERDLAATAVEQAEKAANRVSLISLGVSAAALVVCALLSLTFVRAITRPLERAARIADDLAEGDLRTRDVERSADATGRVLGSLEVVSRNLSQIVSEVRSTAQEVNNASGEIASGNADLSARTEHTASALEQTAASVEQLAATIRQSAENAQQADTLARQATSVAVEGGTVVGDVVAAMDEISTQARRIADIIGTIDGIAFQTNILALNAAVEAARAGEQGRGFAVVASEVRSLAQRSGEAAKEIRTLIGSSVEQVERGTARVQVAGDTMTRVVESIQRVSQMVGDITRAASAQASDIAQVNQAIMEMDKTTQQNAAMVEEATAATESLRAQSERLVESLARFKT